VTGPGESLHRLSRVLSATATPERLAGPHNLDAFERTALRPTTPISLINFGEALNFPLIVGLMLALFGAATLLHLLVVSVARRPESAC
jgi:hypothetical protein